MGLGHAATHQVQMLYSVLCHRIVTISVASPSTRCALRSLPASPLAVIVHLFPLADVMVRLCTGIGVLLNRFWLFRKCPFAPESRSGGDCTRLVADEPPTNACACTPTRAVVLFVGGPGLVGEDAGPSASPPHLNSGHPFPNPQNHRCLHVVDL